MARREVLKPLTAEEDLDFQAHDLIVGQGKAAFVAVGKALAAISEGKLWRGRYKDFDDYCRQRLGWSGSHGYRLADASRIAEEIHPLGEIENERQARTLASVPNHLRTEVFQRAKDEAAKTSRGELTEAIIARTHIKVLDERAQQDRDRRDAGRLDDIDEEDGDEESGSEDSPVAPEQETPLARAARTTAEPRLHPLLRAMDHHRLGRKDSRKTVPEDMDDPAIRQRAEQLAEDLETEAKWLRELLATAK